MEKNSFWDEIETLLIELVQFHQTQMLKSARRIVPQATQDDLLQPNDYPELEFNPNFRYEEGVVAGIQTVQTAIRAYKKLMD